MVKKMISLILIGALGVAASGCTSGKKEEASTKPSSATETSAAAPKQDLMKLRFYSEGYESSMTLGSNDVVTPYVEKKFNVKFDEMYMTNDQPFKERLNQWIATKDLPDVMFVSGTSANYAVSTGQFADLTDEIKDMPNLGKWFQDDFWPRFMNEGKKYQIPIPLINANDAKYADDIYNSGKGDYAFSVREDLLAKAGYKFKPLKEIKKDTIDIGKKPTLEDFAIEPAIKTPEDLYTMLKKIKDLNIQVNGKPLIPLSIPVWSQFHMGSMFDFGHWNLAKDGTVDGWLGSKESKDYYQLLNKFYQEGLIDKDFIIQKDDQLQTKAATGQVATVLYLQNMDMVRQSLLTIDPSMELRSIPWPKLHADKGFYDIYEGAYWRMIVKKDFPDIKRLTQYLDWTLSDEGLDILSWGPESAGLWVMKDGKKVFKDPEVEKDMISGKLGGKGADYYGIYSKKFYSKAAYFGLSYYMGQDYNPKNPLRSYPPQYDIYMLNNALVSAGGVDYNGVASYGDGGKKADGVSSFYWSKFSNLDVAKVLTAKTPEIFNKNWDAIYTNFLKETDYEAAKADMVKWFQANPPKAK